MRFTIRPRPVPGESLTGYLMRIAEANIVDFTSIYRAVFKGPYHRSQVQGSYNIDIVPGRKVHVYELATLLGLSVEEIESMTLKPVVTKFTNDLLLEETGNFLTFSRFVHTDGRRFCPVCLKEKKMYKLIWQIADLTICEIHGVNLETNCPCCGKRQPYVSQTLTQGVCHYCQKSLYNCDGKSIKDDHIAMKRLPYRDWNFLLDDSKSLINYQNSLSLEQNLAAKLLYLAQSRESEYSLGRIKYLDKNYIFGLKRFIKDDDSVTRPTILQTFKLLREAGLGIEEFSNVVVPSSYINSLLYGTEQKDYKVCLTPWCKSSGSNAAMVKIKINRFSEGLVCTHCFNKFGVSQEGGWQEAGNNIELVNKIRVYLDNGMSPENIAKELGVSIYIVWRLIGYIAFNRLANDSVCKLYTPRQLDECKTVLNLCKELIGKRVNFYKLFTEAQKHFGLTLEEFSYYFASQEVQYYIALEKPSQKDQSVSLGWSNLVDQEIERMFVNNEEITVKDIAKNVGCDEENLRYFGLLSKIGEARDRQQIENNETRKQNLWDAAKKFVEHKHAANQPFQCQDIYKTIGKYPSWVAEYCPELGKWITEIVRENKRRLVLKRYEELVSSAIRELEDSCTPITIINVARLLNLNPKTIRYYPELVKMIKCG